MNNFLKIIFTLLVCFLQGCTQGESSEKDTELANELCECIEKSEVVNEYSASFFERDYSEQGKDSLDQMLKERDEYCEKFQNLHPTKLQNAAKDCELLENKTDSTPQTN